jgi:hypothetical protein
MFVGYRNSRQPPVFLVADQVRRRFCSHKQCPGGGIGVGAGPLGSDKCGAFGDVVGDGLKLLRAAQP